MEGLFKQFAFKIRSIDYEYKRFLFEIVEWSRKLVIIKGTRKTGKSTLVLQYVKENCNLDGKTLYVNADDFYFSTNSLQNTAIQFAEHGGTHLFIDDIHKYASWEAEIVQVLNKFENLKIVLIGSSAVNYTSNEVIAQTAVIYEVPGLSLREFVYFSTGRQLSVISITDLFSNYSDLSMKYSKVFDVLQLFNAYLNYGYYPFFKENRLQFAEKLNETVNLLIENDLTQVNSVDFGNVGKLKKLLNIIIYNEAEHPNTKLISEIIGSGRTTVLDYLEYLAHAGLLILLKEQNTKDGQYTKPDQVYPANPNFYSNMFYRKNSREYLLKTFFLSQLANRVRIEAGTKGDFIIDNTYRIVIKADKTSGGSLFEESGTYIGVDDIEIGVRNKIPLWLFGFLY